MIQNHKPQSESNSDRVLYTLLPDIVFHVQYDGLILHCKLNCSQAVFTTKGPMTFEGCYLHEIRDIGDADTEMAVVRKAIDQQQILERSYTVAVLGEIKHYHIRVAPENQDNAWVFIRDDTSRVNALDTLKRSENRYRALVNAMNEGCALFDVELDEFDQVRDASIVDANASFERLTGLVRKSVVGRSLKWLFRDFADPWIHYFQKCLADEREVHITRYSELFKRHFEYRLHSPKPARVVMTLTDVTDQVHATEVAEASQQQLRDLHTHIQSAREDERRCIAHEIHDELGQTLTAIRIGLKRLQQRAASNPDEIEATTEQLLDFTDRMLVTVKRISSELRPSVLDHLGLAAAIEWQIEEYKRSIGAEWTVIQELEEVDVPAEVGITLFRVLQETCTNIARHALAQRVKIVLKSEKEHLVLSINDNGVGLNCYDHDHPRTFGILGMRERTQALGGTFEIISKPHVGTTVTVRLPQHVAE